MICAGSGRGLRLGFGCGGLLRRFGGILNGLGLFNIKLLDHIIITRNSCLSLLE